jgi:hypothetical protein
LQKEYKKESFGSALKRALKVNLLGEIPVFIGPISGLVGLALGYYRLNEDLAPLCLGLNCKIPKLQRPKHKTEREKAKQIPQWV